MDTLYARYFNKKNIIFYSTSHNSTRWKVLWTWLIDFFLSFFPRIKGAFHFLDTKTLPFAVCFFQSSVAPVHEHRPNPIKSNLRILIRITKRANLNNYGLANTKERQKKVKKTNRPAWAYFGAARRTWSPAQPRPAHPYSAQFPYSLGSKAQMSRSIVSLHLDSLHGDPAKLRLLLFFFFFGSNHQVVLEHIRSVFENTSFRTCEVKLLKHWLLVCIKST